MKRPSSTPKIVSILGYGGLIPFIGFALVSLTNLLPTKLVVTGISYYGATILSFVAALHWGFAMTMKSLSESEQTRRYIWSVIPPLLAWVALLMPTTACLLILIGGFIAHFGQDLYFDKLTEVELPNWYIPLRIRLTTIAVLSLSIVLLNQ
jgi:hypothetical protein